MSREIKFRAWNKETAKMVFPEDNDCCFELTDTGLNVLDLTKEPDRLGFSYYKVDLMQYTGLKDVNGVEIYEGDLVEHDDNVDGEWFTYEATLVVYDEEYAQFCFEWDSSNFLANYKNLNVIGNIYENPELLQEDN